MNLPVFGIPSFGIPAFGIPAFGIPDFGTPGFGISVSGRVLVWVFPTFGIPAFGIPVFGIPNFGIPGFGIPAFGVFFEFRHPLIRHPLNSPQQTDATGPFLRHFKGCISNREWGVGSVVVESAFLRRPDFQSRGSLRVSERSGANIWAAPNADPTTTDPTPHSQPEEREKERERERERERDAKERCSRVRRGRF